MNFGCLLYKLALILGARLSEYNSVLTSNRISLALREEANQDDQASALPCRDSDAEYAQRASDLMDADHLLVSQG